MYNRKTTEWNHEIEVNVYRHPILTAEDKESKKKKATGARRRYSQMNDAEKRQSNLRRESYYRKRVAYLCNLAIHNNLTMFWTLTFKEDIQSYDEAKHYWELYLKRLKYEFGEDIKYIATHELQKERKVYHFHFLTDISFNDCSHARMEKIWGYGYTFYLKINGSIKNQRKQIAYQFKYIVKDIHEDEERKNQRKIYCSRSLEKPEIYKELSDKSMEDIIFENMENVVNTNTYDMKNYQGFKINEVDSVRIQKP